VLFFIVLHLHGFTCSMLMTSTFPECNRQGSSLLYLMPTSARYFSGTSSILSYHFVERRLNGVKASSAIKITRTLVMVLMFMACCCSLMGQMWGQFSTYANPAQFCDERLARYHLHLLPRHRGDNAVFRKPCQRPVNSDLRFLLVKIPRALRHLYDFATWQNAIHQRIYPHSL
jgi:hypothetical protein